MDADPKRPLKEVAEAFAGLADGLSKSSNAQLPVAEFATACDRLSPLFGTLGMAFKFAEKDYVAKVKDLGEAGEQFDSLPAMIDGDISANTVQQLGSHTRNLLRVKRGVDMVRLLFQHTLLSIGDSLKDPASIAYNEVFSPHHSWPIRKAVSAGMYVLPSKSGFMARLNEKEETAEEYMQSFVKSSQPVLLYVNGLFTSKELGLDW